MHLGLIWLVCAASLVLALLGFLLYAVSTNWRVELGL